MFAGGITKDEAVQLLRTDLMKFCRGVEAIVKVPITDNQFAALVSFAFNAGVMNLTKSTLLRLVNEQQFEAAARISPRDRASPAAEMKTAPARPPEKPAR